MTEMKTKTRKILFIAGIIVACGFLLFGIFRGEVAIVLSRAVNVCLECIGLGQ